MTEHGAEEIEPRHFGPRPELKDYLSKRLQISKQMDQIEAAGEEIPHEIYASNKSLSTKKVRILNGIIFQAMADLTYFFGRIAEHPELRDVFDGDIKDLLGLRHNAQSQRPGYVFSRLIRSILILDKKDVRRRREETNDYRLILTDLLQQAVQDKIRGPLSNVLGTQEAINNVLNDFSRARGWTIMLKHRVQQDLANEVPHRTFVFDNKNSLIILRGPAGSGKTCVCNAIMQILGKKNSCKLDLDITNPQEDKFEKNLMKCLSSENVIGMIFDSNSHTTDRSRYFEKRSTRFYQLFYMLARRRASTGVEVITTQDGRLSIKKRTV